MSRKEINPLEFKVRTVYDIPDEFKSHIKEFLKSCYFQIDSPDYSYKMTEWCGYDFKSRRIKLLTEIRGNKNNKKHLCKNINLYTIENKDNTLIAKRQAFISYQNIDFDKKVITINIVQNQNQNVYSCHANLEKNTFEYFNDTAKRKLKSNTKFCVWDDSYYVHIDNSIYDLDIVKKSSYDKFIKICQNEQMTRSISTAIITSFKYFKYRQSFPEIDNLIQKEFAFAFEFVHNNVNLYNYFFEGKTFKKNFILPKECLELIQEEYKKSIYHGVTQYQLMGALNQLQYHTKSLTVELVKEIIAYKNSAIGYRNNFISNLKDIVIEHGIDIKQLFAYIERCDTYQAITPSDTISLYKDYLESAKKLKMDKFDKYPNSLKREHDVFAREAVKVLNQIEEQSFEDRMKEHNDISYENDTFCIVVPKTAEDLRQEGRELSHCVGTYVSKVAAGKSVIFFVRKKENKDTALYTLEVQNNRISQFRGKHNCSPSEEAKEFAESFILEKFKGMKKGEVAGLAM